MLKCDNAEMNLNSSIGTLLHLSIAHASYFFVHCERFKYLK